MNVVEEIVDIRERLAKMEGSIEHLVKMADKSSQQIQKIPKEASGNIVIPVVAVVAFIQIAQVCIEKFF